MLESVLDYAKGAFKGIIFTSLVGSGIDYFNNGNLDYLYLTGPSLGISLLLLSSIQIYDSIKKRNKTNYY